MREDPFFSQFSGRFLPDPFPNDVKIAYGLMAWEAKKIQKRLQNCEEDPLRLACFGKHKPSTFHLVDATAGLGYDAYLLAAWGGKVLMLEKNVSVFTVLFQAMSAKLKLQRLSESGPFVLDRMHLLNVDAAQLFCERWDTPAEVVYIDLMFPKTFAAKSGVQPNAEWLRRQGMGTNPSLSEPDYRGALEHLLGLALRVARRWVVVKRPRKRMALIRRPDQSFGGKGTVNWDRYLVKP